MCSAALFMTSNVCSFLSDIIAYGPAERCSMNESGVDISEYVPMHYFV